MDFVAERLFPGNKRRSTSSRERTRLRAKPGPARSLIFSFVLYLPLPLPLPTSAFPPCRPCCCAPLLCPSILGGDVGRIYRASFNLGHAAASDLSLSSLSVSLSICFSLLQTLPALQCNTIRLGLAGTKIGDVRIDKIIDKHSPASI